MTTEATEAAQAAQDDALLSSQEQETQDPNLGNDPPAEPTEGEAQAEQPEAKARKSAQDRIDELTRDKHAERRRAEALERELEQLRPKAAPAQQPQADAEPDPSAYTFGETDPAYVRDLARYEVRQEFEAQAQKQAARQQAQTIEQQFASRQQEFAKTKPDYQSVVMEKQWACTPDMTAAILAADDGPAVAYHLANNPDEARRIAGLTPHAQILELGRIAARIAPAQQQQARTVSNAPAPAPTVRGLNGQFKVSPDTDDFPAFDKAY